MYVRMSNSYFRILSKCNWNFGLLAQFTKTDLNIIYYCLENVFDRNIFHPWSNIVEHFQV